MKKKRNVFLTQVNYQYGNNVFVPYSVGSIQAYSKTIPEVRENFQFHEPIFLRKDPNDVVLGLHEPSIVGFSCYVWNWEYNNVLAKLVKAKFPECLIVFGGPQVPDASEGFFINHLYVDILIHHEGEFSFSEILLEFLLEKPDYAKIPGLSIKVSNNQTLKTAPSVRIQDLSKLPSPYLSGVFDFMLDKRFLLNVSQETNRGCPFSCTFCDWGGSTHSKLSMFDEMRILEEFEWFGRNKTEYLFSCDANLGISKDRDLNLTKYMLAIRAKWGGFPKKFRMCTAKNSNDEIFIIAKMLNDAGMSKGATLSFQSMDEVTLGIVKRRNIKLEVFSHLMERYHTENIQTYTELIMGMPGETYESTKKGIDILFEDYADSINLNAYVCTMLPNSEMSKPVYVKQNKIKSVRMPLLLGHSTPDLEKDSIVEYEDVIVETSSMSNTIWQHTHLFYWMLQAFHCLGLTQYIAILFRKHFGIKYSDFYEKLIEYFSLNEETLIGKEITLIKSIISHSVNGGRFDLVLPRFGNIYWPLEEASFLTLVTDKDKFYQELRLFVGVLARNSGQTVDDTLLDDIILYQESLVIDPYTIESKVELRYNLYEYFIDIRKKMSLIYSPTRLVVKANKAFNGELETFAREVVWYGRKGGSFRHTNIKSERLKALAVG
jgi:radical SAM superfamily enzyme YgiQ (UPF0313 family)